MGTLGSFHGNFRRVEAPVGCSMTAAPTKPWAEAVSREASVEAMEVSTVVRLLPGKLLRKLLARVCAKR